MKTLRIASILVASALTVFACGDDDDTSPRGGAGSPGSAGEGGSDAAGAAGATDNNAAGQAMGGGSSAGQSNGGAVAGGAGGTPEGGAGGATEAPCINDVESIVGGAAGAGGDGGASSRELEPAILGTWKEVSFPGTLEITSSHWNEGTIQAWDNDAHVVYTQNSSCALYSPRKFSKYVYTVPAGDSFYYCTIVFAADTLAQAQADTKVANVNDLDGAGCSGFPWSKVTKQ